jgi:triacylglycerol lipase
MWRELGFGIEAALLHAAPVYWGLGAPQGDRSGVIVIPGFLGTDAYLVEMYAWLHRMNYRPYFSDIGINAECPNLLVRRRLNATIDRAVRETGGRVHLIGHSLGGMIALSAGIQRPWDVASVITLGAPFRGNVAHPNVLRLAEMVRGWIKARHGESVLPDCYTGRCSCDFVNSLRLEMPSLSQMTAIYTRTDGIVDWRYCITGDPALDFEVPGTHVGLAFNPVAYRIMALRLAQASERVKRPAA